MATASHLPRPRLAGSPTALGPTLLKLITGFKKENEEIPRNVERKVDGNEKNKTVDEKTEFYNTLVLKTVQNEKHLQCLRKLSADSFGRRRTYADCLLCYCTEIVTAVI